MFDTAILLYVDRFCPDIPNRVDLSLFEQFVTNAFIWAYSMRAQYYNVGWLVAQNYILGNSDIRNSFNIYKAIIEADTPSTLLSTLAQKLKPLAKDSIRANQDNIEMKEGEVYQNYLYYFKENKFLEEQ